MADHNDIAGAAASNSSLQDTPPTVVTVLDSPSDQPLPKLSKDQLHSQSEGAVSPELLKNISELAAANREKYRRTGSLQEKAHQRDQTTDPLPYQTVLSRNKVLGNVLGDVQEGFSSFVWPTRELSQGDPPQLACAWLWWIPHDPSSAFQFSGSGYSLNSIFPMFWKGAIQVL